MTTIPLRAQNRTSTLSFRTVLVAISITFLLALSGCGDDDQSEEAATAATSFMQAYYQGDDLSAALQFSTGAAKAKVQEEQASDQKFGQTEPSEDKPTISSTLLDTKRIDGSTYVLAWKVTASTSNELHVELTMQRVGDQWLVSDFVENEPS